MSFAFDFSGDDIEEGAADSREVLVKNLAEVSLSSHPVLLAVKRHDFKELLSSIPSRLSFNLLTIPRIEQGQRNETVIGSPGTVGEVVVARRALFDIRAQLMAEADPLENSHDNLLAGLEAGDLASGIYEGGFKTWECALDLASFVSSLDLVHAQNDWHIIELGAGTAIPSLTILSTILGQTESVSRAQFHFSLCDYNEDVLRLVTVPNAFLAGLKTLQHESTDIQQYAKDDQDDLETDDIDETRIQSFLSELQERKVSFDFLSGTWGSEFLELIQQASSPGEAGTNTLILASETIYSPSSVKAFTDTLIELIRRGGNLAKAYVGAKRVYFGVGGGVDDFVREATKSGAVVKEVVDVRTEGVGRVILQVTLAKHEARAEAVNA